MWQLPNPSHFLDEVVDSLAGAKHAVVMLPEPLLASEPVWLLSKRISASGLGGLTEVSLGKSEHADILDAISAELGYETCDIPTIEAFLDKDDLPSRYLAITGVENGGEKWLSRLSLILLRAGEHAQVSDVPPFNLIVFVSPRFVPPPLNVKLAHHIWWGVLSRLDIDCVTERSLVAYPPASLAEHYWLRALCMGVAQGDPSLAQVIIELSPKNVDDLCTLLQNHVCDQILEIPETSYRYPESILGTHRISPPVNGSMRKLWSRGYLDWQDGSGILLHPSLLVSAGRRKDIERLIWKGQMQIILPAVEQVRQTIIHWLESEYGDDWVDCLVGPLNEEDRSGLTGELGPLCYHLFRSNSPIRRSVFGFMADMAWKWREIRNEISHSRPISLEVIADAFRSYVEVIKREKLTVDFEGML